MPVHKVPPGKEHPNGGYRWGGHGHVYPPTPEGKKLAERQAGAAFAHGYTGKEQPMVTTKVAVHKAGLPLSKGESVRDFTQAMAKAGTDYLYRKLNKTANDVGVFAAEVYSDGAVFEVYNVKSNPGEPSYKFYAVKFNRMKDGTFDFTTMTEVKRTMTWVQKAGAPMTVQTLILSKKKFKTRAEAEAWVKKTPHFNVKSVNETGDSWRFRQIPPGKFDKNTFRTISMTDGVSAVVGKLLHPVKKSAPDGWIPATELLWDGAL